MDILNKILMHSTITLHSILFVLTNCINQIKPDTYSTVCHAVNSNNTQIKITASNCSTTTRLNSFFFFVFSRMKYSPQQQQQQQKERKSESEMSSVNATPSRAASALQRSASAASAAASQSTSAARRALTCRPLSTDMFAWMRVFRLATMLHQVGC